MTGLVFQEENMVFSRENTGSPVVPGVFVFVVRREYGNGRGLGVGRKKPMGVHHRTKRDVAKIRRSIMVTDHAVRKQGEGVGVVAVKLSRPLHADASPAVGMVYEDKLAPVGMGFFNRRELSRFGSVRLLFLADG